MDEKLKKFIKEEIIDKGFACIIGSLIGTQYDIEVENKESNKANKETCKITLFALTHGIPKSIDEVLKITLFAYNQDTKTVYKPLNAKVFYAPLTKIKGICNPYWAFCYGNITFDLDEMVEYKELVHMINDDKLSFE